jgi:3-oxoacyl-[acyl-carrier protein] reductase
MCPNAPIETIGRTNMTDVLGERALQGKVAVVTGSSRNIGRAIAHALAANGASVLVHGSHDLQAAEATARELEQTHGVKTHVHLAQIGDPQACTDLVDVAVKHFGRLDIMVCNAAIRRQTPFLEMDYEQWRAVITTDLDSVFCLTRAAAPHLVNAGGGSIVCLGGTPSHMSTTRRAHVSAAKMGVVGLSRVLANELGPHGINVNVVCPGHIDTSRGASAGATSTVTESRAFVRKGMPEEIAAMVCHLCLPLGRYVTGQSIHVNGGMLFTGA